MTVTKTYLQSMGIPEAVAAQILADVARDTAEAQKAAQPSGAPTVQPQKADQRQTGRAASLLDPLTPFAVASAPVQTPAPLASVQSAAQPSAQVPVQTNAQPAPKGRDKPAEGDSPASGDKDTDKKLDNQDDVLKRLARLEQENADQKAQLAARAYEDAAKAGVAEAKVRFTSKAAERDFYAAVRERKFALKDGKLDGLAAFISARRQEEPDAFASDTPVPRFVSATPSGGPHVAQSSQTKSIIGRILAEQYGVGTPRADNSAAGQKE